LLTAVCWFALGETMARNRQPAAVLLIATLLLTLLTLAALRWSLRIAIVPIAAVWMVIGCWCAEIQPAPPAQQALASYADGLSRQIRGRVVRVRELPPQPEEPDHDKEVGWWAEKEADEEAATVGTLSVDIQVDSIEEVTPDISRMVPMTGGVRINVIAEPVNTVVWPTLKCGDIVEAPMRIKVAERYRDPGAWQYADYLLAQGIGAHASVRQSKIERLNEPGTSLATGARQAAQLQCRIYAAQSWASGRVLSYVRSKANRWLPKSSAAQPE
jgi:competence protein ComEC